KSVTVEEQVEELIFEMASDDIEQTVDDVENYVNQPLNDSTQTKDKDPKKGWFKQPPRPPTPNQEWNKRQVVDDQPKQHCTLSRTSLRAVERHMYNQH
ncbi:hypothetical protein Tco_0479710, partial [Tanacetum coccineum]